MGNEEKSNESLLRQAIKLIEVDSLVNILIDKKIITVEEWNESNKEVLSKRNWGEEDKLKALEIIIK